MTHGPVPQLPPSEAHRHPPGAVLLDVREPDEWAAGHAPEARHLPLGRLAAEYQDLPRDAPVLCLCRSGGRSQQAAAALRNAGYDARNVAGGMQAWLADGLPVVDDRGDPGSVI